ncbi:DUF4198 domain-containing protein [Sphingomonas sp. AP4-R1]|nr:DUF4198 domain-containing protein [Sphingomonas sp. AP4-R1]
MALRGALGVLMLAPPAAAHMPYVLPSVFDVGTRSAIGIEAAFSEDAFRPEIGMDNAPFEATGPNGTTVRLAAPTRLGDRTVAEAPLSAEGIWRISSGQRLGRMNRMVRDGATWKVLGEDAAAPAGATILKVQSTTLADAYVLRGHPGAAGALKPRGTGLEIHPLGDPTAAGKGEPIAFEILYQGKPLPGATVSAFREAGYYDGRKTLPDAITGADGRFSLTPPDAGRYLLLVRHRDAAPQTAAAPYYSYSVTLAFEAM